MKELSKKYSVIYLMKWSEKVRHMPNLGEGKLVSK